MSYNLRNKETGELIPIAGKGDFPCDYGTKEEFNAKKDSLPDGTVFTTTDEFVDAHAEHYSTNEKVIGTWIDGKPIYRKTIEYSMPSGSTSTELFKLSDWNVKRFIKCYGWGYNTTSSTTISNVNQRAIPSYVSAQDYADIWINTNNSVFIYSSGYNSGHITFEYTKTTDD